MTTEFDLIVIGAGTAAENVADRAVQGGLSVALIESELVGGECSYWACMPSKALIRAGMAIRAAQRVDGARQAVTGSLDVEAVFARRDRIVHDWDDHSQVEWVEGAGIELIRGHGRLAGVKRVDVTTPDGGVIELTARHAVALGTGSDVLVPDIVGLADAQPWTSREATSAKTVPASLAIIGGGAVAVEMATAFASFGSSVTVIARSGLMRNAEDFVPELVTKGLESFGVIVTKASPTLVSRSEDGVAIELDNGDAITAEQVLAATGRKPKTTDLGLDTVGIEPGKWLDVNDTMLVTAATNDDEQWLYAVGDVNSRALLTHQGKYQARAAGDVIAARATGKPVDDTAWGAHVATADHTAVPQVTFSDPEVASVGLTSAAAREAGFDIRIVDYNLGWLGGATVYADDYEGSARMVVDEKRKVVLGVTFVGPDVSELLQAATIAIVGEVPIHRLWHAVPAYPTLNEIWLRLLETYGRESALSG